MASPTTPLPIPVVAQQNVITYLTAAMSLYGGSFNIRNQLLARDRAYYREEDQSTEQRRAALANAQGDPTKIQNLTVPVVMPQVESALAYQVETFLTGYPIFGVVAPPAMADAIEQFETIIADNCQQSGWQAELMKTMRDGYKYDLGAIEVVWETKKTYSIETPELTNLAQGKVKEEQYSGNYMYHRSPYNLLLDTRVSPDRNHIEGEYAGYTERLSRIATKQRMADLNTLGTMNFKAAWESGTSAISSGATTADGNYYVPDINPNALLPTSQNLEFSWANWAGMNQAGQSPNVAYKNSYEWTVLYARIIPKELGMNIARGTEVQIWKFIIINRSVVIYAERQTNAHNFLPIIVCKPSNDGMGYQSKSFAENVTPAQNVATALQNSALASQKKKVYDRLFYDPSKIRKQDIDNTSPVARIPVKNVQMGKDLQSAVMAFPYRDDGIGETLQLSMNVANQADITNGQNRVQQGQFQKGNKTRSEFETTMNNSNSRQRMSSIGMECTFWMPIKQIVKTNILQYQPPTTLLNTSTAKAVTIDPAVLRKAMLAFKMSDGLLPSDKIIDPMMFNSLLQAAPAMPQIQAEYDLMGMFQYMMTLKGAHWIKDFKRDAAQIAAANEQMRVSAEAAGKREVPQPPPEGAQ